LLHPPTFTEEVVVSFNVEAAFGSTLTCTEGNALDVNDAVPDDPGVAARIDACTAIDDLLGDPTVIVGPGDTIDVTTLENPSVVVVAPDTSSADVTETFTTMPEDSTTEFLPEGDIVEAITMLS